MRLCTDDRRSLLFICFLMAFNGSNQRYKCVCMYVHEGVYVCVCVCKPQSLIYVHSYIVNVR